MQMAFRWVNVIHSVQINTNLSITWYSTLQLCIIAHSLQINYLEFVWSQMQVKCEVWGNQSLTTLSKQQMIFTIFCSLIQHVALPPCTTGNAHVNPSAQTKADEISFIFLFIFLQSLLPRLKGNPGALQSWPGNPVSGWLTLRSFVNQPPFPLIRSNSPTACVEPQQKHVIQWEKQVGFCFSGCIPSNVSNPGPPFDAALHI